jgi:hypothetical protein
MPSFERNSQRSSPKSRPSSSLGNWPSIEKAGWTKPLDPSIYEEEGEDSEFIEIERKDILRRAANELLLIERAKEWLLEGSDT